MLKIINKVYNLASQQHCVKSLRTQTFSTTCLIYYTLIAANIQKELQVKQNTQLFSAVTLLKALLALLL